MLFEIKNGNAGGVDVGSKFHCASIGPMPNQQMTVGVTTTDLRKLCEWFVSNKVETVAMESTGFYWKQLFVMIQEYGMEAVLVNPQFTKNIRNRKPSDMADAQWIWKLHATGLLPSSFQPSAETEQIRTLARHRKSLIEGTSRCVKKMQKSLVLMNIQLPAVISDIMGTSGKAIIKAILSDQRDAKELAQLAGKNLKTSKEDLERALEGNWRESNLFELKQNYDQYEFLRSQIEECDQKIDELINLLLITDVRSEDVIVTKSKKKRRQANAPKFKIEDFAKTLNGGIDIMNIEGVSYDTVFTLLSEVGFEELKTKFKSSKHFVSWLGLCPNNKVSGGKLLSSRTTKGNKNLRNAFINAAVGAAKVKNSPLFQYYNRIKSRAGTKIARMATAKKIATIAYTMIVKKVEYEPTKISINPEKLKCINISRIQKMMQKHNITFEEIA